MQHEADGGRLGSYSRKRRLGRPSSRASAQLGSTLVDFDLMMTIPLIGPSSSRRRAVSPGSCGSLHARPRSAMRHGCVAGSWSSTGAHFVRGFARGHRRRAALIFRATLAGPVPLCVVVASDPNARPRSLGTLSRVEPHARAPARATCPCSTKHVRAPVPPRARGDKAPRQGLFFASPTVSPPLGAARAPLGAFYSLLKASNAAPPPNYHRPIGPPNTSEPRARRCRRRSRQPSPAAGPPLSCVQRPSIRYTVPFLPSKACTKPALWPHLGVVIKPRRVARKAPPSMRSSSLRRRGRSSRATHCRTLRGQTISFARGWYTSQ